MSEQLRPIAARQGAAPSDVEAVALVRQGDVGAFEWLMRRHNQRAFRVARSIVRDDGEAEDAIQEAYLSAFVHLNDFRGEAPFGAWLHRIVVQKALARRRGLRPIAGLSQEDRPDEPDVEPGPEREVLGRELACIVEDAIDALPDDYRTTFMLRAVEGMTAPETAELLGISEHTVRSRVHRARSQLRSELRERVELTLPEVHRFLNTRCDRTVARVFERIEAMREQAH
jgi:RNA polymerase sigma-70 factor, ECF subfamily